MAVAKVKKMISRTYNNSNQGKTESGISTPKSQKSKSRLMKKLLNRGTSRLFRSTIKQAVKRAALVYYAAEAAWAFASAALWGDKIFSSGEATMIKAKLEAMLNSEQEPDIALIMFFERILLARKYLQPYGEMPLPSEWFDEKCTTGYNSTRLLADELKRIRQSVPMAFSEFTILAARSVDFYKSPSAELFRGCIESMQIIKEPGLAVLFRLYAANLHYGL